MHRDLGRRPARGTGLGSVAEAVGRVEGGGEQWAEHSAGGTAARFGRAAKLAALAAACGAAHQRGARSRRYCGSAGRSGSPRRPRDARVLDLVGHRRAGGRGDHLGRDVLGDDLPPQARGRPDVPPRQTQYNLPIEIIFTVVPTIIVAVLFAFTVQRAEQRRRRGAGPGPEGGRHRVPVELAVHLPGQPRTPTGSRSPRSARPTRSRCWCCRPTGRIQFTQRSNDVIHSFWVPEFLFKRDVFPMPESQRPGQRLADRPDRP